MADAEEHNSVIRRVRTLFDLKDRSPSPHRIYMRISALEMEKKRQTQERDNALRRVEAISRRVEEITQEVEQLLKTLNLNNNAVPQEKAVPKNTLPSSPRRTAAQPLEQSSSQQKFVIKY